MVSAQSVVGFILALSLMSGFKQVTDLHVE